MAVKIAGHLFTGPLSIEKTVYRANRKETVFAILGKEGSSWDPVFRLLDLGRTGPQGMVFAAHPRAGNWLNADGEPAAVYLLDVATQDHLVQKLDEVVEEIFAKHPIHSEIR